MINLRVNYFGFIILFTAFVISCSNSETITNKKLKQNYLEKTNIEYKGKQYYTFYNGVEGYQILIPVNWLYKNNKNTALTIYTTKENDLDFVESVDIISQSGAFQQEAQGTIKSDKIDFYSFYSTHKNDLVENMNLSIAAEGEELINKKNSRWILFRSSNEGEKLHLLKYFINAREKVYIITATCKESDYGFYGPQFNDIINSFILVNG